MALKDQLEYGIRNRAIHVQRAILTIYLSIYSLFFNSTLNIGLFKTTHLATRLELHKTTYVRGVFE
jgi:hypothetical protein